MKSRRATLYYLSQITLHSKHLPLVALPRTQRLLVVYTHLYLALGRPTVVGHRLVCMHVKRAEK